MAGHQPQGGSDGVGTDFAELAQRARARAEAAGERAEALRLARRARVELRSPRPSALSAADIAVARRSADEARGRLIAALIGSAAAHERAAAMLETPRPGYPAPAQRVRDHRAAAAADRAEAERLASTSD